MNRFKPERLEPNSVSMGMDENGAWVKYDDLPVWYRKSVELFERLTKGSKTPQDQPKRAE
jgi:hypothetical protein